MSECPSVRKGHLLYTCFFFPQVSFCAASVLLCPHVCFLYGERLWRHPPFCERTDGRPLRYQLVWSLGSRAMPPPPEVRTGEPRGVCFQVGPCTCARECVRVCALPVHCKCAVACGAGRRHSEETDDKERVCLRECVCAMLDGAGARAGANSRVTILACK